MGTTVTDSAELVIRRVTAEDAVSVAELTVQLGYSATVDGTRGRIVELALRQDTQAVFVACHGDEVVGWIDVALAFHLQTPPFALIGGLVVKDGVRGLRIGKRLCDEVEAWSLARGVSVVRVTSRSTRADAHRFYLRNGYTDVKLSRVFEKVLG